MAVTGYLGLYTTLLGWQTYDTLWGLMVGTGLAFLPFIAIVANGFLLPYESQEPKNAAVITLRRLALQVVGALLVIELACVPTMPLTPKILHFAPPCSAAQATPDHSGTTYDHQFALPTDVKVPLLWYLVMAVANGIDRAAIKGLPCAPIDYRALHLGLALARIDNANLKKETVRFYESCYLPAYSQYLRGELNASQRTHINKMLHQHGKGDMAWLGSYALLTTPGFYDRYRAPVAIKGFPVDPHLDEFAAQVPAASTQAAGRPRCNDWWQQSDTGLRARLAQQLPPTVWQVVTQVIHGRQALIDAGIQQLMTHSFAQQDYSDHLRHYTSLNSYQSAITNALPYIGARMGVLLHQTSYYPTLYLIKNAIPVVQALLLMALYGLLAVVLPFSSYRVNFIVTAASVMFALTFWSFLSHWVANLDNRLLAALYHPTSMSLTDHVEVNFVDMIIGGLYIALPLLLLSMLSWAGIRAGHAMMGLFDSASGLSQQAGGQLKQASTTALRSGVRLIK